MGQLAIDATQWKTAEWAREKGLFAEVHDNIEDMHASVNTLANKLAQSNPEALSKIKAITWDGTDHWDSLLEQRAEVSGQLVLSAFTRNAIKSFKNS